MITTEGGDFIFLRWEIPPGKFHLLVCVCVCVCVCVVFV